MILRFNTNGDIRVFRESSDTKFYGTKNGAGESNLLHQIKNLLNSAGFNLIKKRMWKDGHLVDDMQQYLRDQKSRYCYRNNHWAVRGLNDDWNKLGSADLMCDWHTRNPKFATHLISLKSHPAIQFYAYEENGIWHTFCPDPLFETLTADQVSGALELDSYQLLKVNGYSSKEHFDYYQAVG